MVKWTSVAKTDLKSIFDFINNDSEYYAQKVVNDIIDKTESLDNFPKRGRKVPEINETNVREIFLYSYRIIYELINDDIYILTLVNFSKDFKKSK